MLIEQAIITALEFEKRVRKTYEEAMSDTKDPAAKKIYGLLAEEEEGHVAFLEANLNLWKNEGRLSMQLLGLEPAEAGRVDDGAKKLDALLTAETARGEMEALEKALQAEVETSAFYARLVRDLPEEGKVFFQRFLEIEQGHVALLEAEISAAKSEGYWFTAREFDLEKS